MPLLADTEHSQVFLCVCLVGALSQYNNQSVSRREVFHLPTEVSTRTNVAQTMLNEPYFSGISPPSTYHQKTLLLFKHKSYFSPQRA